MNILIIEDEKETAENLERVIRKSRSDAKIVGLLSSVDESINYLISNQDNLDLIFMDIELSDGSGFEIFEELEIRKPIIFVTAYGEFISKSFEVNNLNYLVKPITEEDVINSFEKYNRLYSNGNEFNLNLPKPKTKTRFLVKTGSKNKILLASDIEYIVKDDLVFAISEGKKYVLNYSLDELNERLDPYQFFRINRQEIINFNIVDSIESYFGGRLFINHSSAMEKDLIVSQRRSSSFKSWVESF